MSTETDTGINKQLHKSSLICYHQELMSQESAAAIAQQMPAFHHYVVLNQIMMSSLRSTSVTSVILAKLSSGSRDFSHLK